MPCGLNFSWWVCIGIVEFWGVWFKWIWFVLRGFWFVFSYVALVLVGELTIRSVWWLMLVLRWECLLCCKLAWHFGCGVIYCLKAVLCCFDFVFVYGYSCLGWVGLTVFGFGILLLWWFLGWKWFWFGINHVFARLLVLVFLFG